jgi:hypothetical protein
LEAALSTVSMKIGRNKSVIDYFPLHNAIIVFIACQQQAFINKNTNLAQLNPFLPPIHSLIIYKIVRFQLFLNILT